MLVKCLSLWQPWATLVVAGLKRYETRGWYIPYRGRLLIHAARAFSAECQALCRDAPFRSLLRKAGYASAADLPRGGIIGQVFSGHCYRIDSPSHMSVPNLLSSVRLPDVSERLLGNWGVGRYALELSQPQRCHLVPCRGHQRLFWAEVPKELARC